MRRFYITLVSIMVLSCEMASPKMKAISMLVDRTDTAIPNPDITDIREVLGLGNTPNTGVIIKFQNIGNVDYNPIESIELPSGSVLDNSLKRSADIKRFHSAVDSLIIRENDKDYSYNGSSILFSVVEHLDRLSKVDAVSKRILLYSDLAEFSDVYNSYRQRDIVLESPQKVVEHLRSELELGDYKGIELYIIYYPKNPEDNRLFRSWISIYKEIFKDSGLDLRIGRNSNIH